VLFGYSEGALDAVARYPGLQQRADILRHWPKANCDAGDGGAVAPTYRNFGGIDPRNDSQVIYSDQIIPGSTPGRVPERGPLGWSRVQ
jgi:hypothetical protein